ncbi:MAG: hypothetical protein CSA81_08260 [Acidobacteria bacterium]|nr:MAG: hypothetical protein CSA81_08260 [Acidobacteriota bacterium]PIE89718.1 MAG: hypothetical protein CR997_09795 [Acidobacteriota bacterium]
MKKVEVTITVKEQVMWISPCLLELNARKDEGIEVEFILENAEVAVVQFLDDDSPFQESSFELKEGKSIARKVNVGSVSKSFAYTVKTNPKGGGSIIVHPGNG